jgi:hypothetical protein
MLPPREGDLSGDLFSNSSNHCADARSSGIGKHWRRLNLEQKIKICSGSSIKENVHGMETV